MNLLQDNIFVCYQNKTFLLSHSIFCFFTHFILHPPYQKTNHDSTGTYTSSKHDKLCFHYTALYYFCQSHIAMYNIDNQVKYAIIIHLEVK